MSIPDNRVFTRLTDLAACLCAALTDSGLPEPCFCGVMPGDVVAMDYIGDCSELCGMAWVRLVHTYPSKQVGIADIDPNNCGYLLGIDIEVGVMRCVPVGDPNGDAPTAAELLYATQLQVADMLAMHKAISCCDLGDIVLGTYEPIGPQGGAVGGIWPISLMDQ